LNPSEFEACQSRARPPSGIAALLRAFGFSDFGFTEYLPSMELFETVQCPFCGEPMEIGVDTSIAEQSFTIDCEVCCRPFELRVQCEPGEVLELQVL
jgi:hypothetical protein